MLDSSFVRDKDWVRVSFASGDVWLRCTRCIRDTHVTLQHREALLTRHGAGVQSSVLESENWGSPTHRPYGAVGGKQITNIKE